MSLYLIEGFITELQAEKIGQSLDVIAAAAINFGAELIEAQVGEDLQRLFRHLRKQVNPCHDCF